MSDSLKRKLAEVEDELRSLREERADKARKREEAKEAFAKIDGWDANSSEYQAAKDAVAGLGQVDDKIAETQQVQTDILRMLGQQQHPEQARSGNGRPTDPASQREGGNWDSAHLFDEDLKAMLASTAGSKGRFGSIRIGEVVDRDRLAADITDTPFMRRGTYVGVVPQIFRPLRVLDLIPTGTTDGNLVPYTQEGGDLDSGAAETAEGDIKPEGTATYTDASAPVQTIASWQKIRKQALSDYSAVQSMIDFRLRYTVMRRLERQILAGDGTGSNLTGILNTAGIGTVAYSGATPSSELVLTGITNVYLAGAEATGIVLNPIDWQTALTQKAELSSGPPPVGSGDYVGGGPFMNTPQIMWGVPLVPSPALAQGSGLVGDFQIGATLLVREGVNVLLSDSDQDDFIRNRVTMLGEMRAALPVWRPVAFQNVALAA